MVLEVDANGDGIVDQVLDPTCSHGRRGDVNYDNMVDIVDALLVAQYYVSLPVDNFNTQEADVDWSNSIDIVDALMIAQFYVEIIAEFPDCLYLAPPAGKSGF